MARWHRPCSVCSAPPAILNLINAELAKETRLRDIQDICGIHRSSISRHSRKCVPKRKLNIFRDAKRAAANGNIVVWEPGAPRPNAGPNDYVYQIEYESAPINNPAGLMPWTAESQIAFLTRCSTHCRHSFIEDQHAQALAENLAGVAAAFDPTEN